MRRNTTQHQKDFAAAVAKGAQVRQGSQQLASWNWARETRGVRIASPRPSRLLGVPVAVATSTECASA